MKKRTAALTALLCSCLAWGLVVWHTENPACFSAPPEGKTLRAAIAIRDKVPPFQQWGTKAFTLGYLKRYYDTYAYFTQAAKGDKKAEFTQCLEGFLDNYAQVDLFLLAHTNKYIAWVAELPEEKRQRIRLVYNTGCHNLPQAEDWLELGADAYIGHPGKSASSVFYFYFLRRWCRGAPLAIALNESNRLMEQAFGRYALLRRDPARKAKLMKASTAALAGTGEIKIGIVAL